MGKRGKSAAQSFLLQKRFQCTKSRRGAKTLHWRAVALAVEGGGGGGTKRAKTLHCRDRITRALRGDRAAGGGHYKASTRRAVQETVEQVFALLLPARESIRVQTACIATCRALFAGWHLAAVYVAMHIMSRVQRERWFLALRPCSGQGLFFFPCSRASLLHQKTFSYVLLLLLPYNFSIRLHICY